MRLRHSVIHGFKKEPQHPTQEVVKKTVLLDNDLPAVLALASGVATLLGKRANNQVWGHFGNDGREGPFPAQFSAYADSQDESAVFLAITHLAVDQIVLAADAEPFATGGHILFALFDDEDNHPVFLIAMIKQKGGVVLNANYVPVGIVEVDMAKLHQAAQIQVQHFLQDREIPDAGDGEDEIDRNYLSFLSQRSTQTSGYFITALGCVVGISSARATDKIFHAVDAFFQANNEISQYRKAAKERVTEYLQERLNSNEAANLDAICAVLNQVIPVDRTMHLEGVLEFLNGPKYKIPDEFKVHENVLKKHTKITLENPRLKIRFNRSILGTSVNSEICYNRQNKTLVIKNLSDEFIRKLDDTLSDG